VGHFEDPLPGVVNAPFLKLTTHCGKQGHIPRRLELARAPVRALP